MSYDFTNRQPATQAQFKNAAWENGLDVDALQSRVAALEASELPRAIIKAKTFALICEQGQIAVDKADIFQDKLNGGKIMHDQRKRWEKAVVDAYLKEDSEANHGARKCGAYYGHGDYGHVSPNSALLMKVGFKGLLERVERFAAREDLTKSQHVYYDSCKIVLNAMMTAAVRLPLDFPIATIASASSRASSGVFIKAPLPHLTSSTIERVPAASFLLIIEDAISGILFTVAVTSRRA